MPFLTDLARVGSVRLADTHLSDPLESLDSVNAGGRDEAAMKLESGTMRLISKPSWGLRRCDKP